jgi:two-component system OmpR family response regulator
MALSSLRINSDFDLIILDLTLPGLDGLEVCKELVRDHKIPIIISSARSDITDKVMALELGADDYLPKPYDPRELEARIKTVLRRYNKKLENIEYNNKLFNLDRSKKEITKNSQFIKLTAAEYELLSYFIEHESFVISRGDLLDNTNISSDESGGSLSVIINRLRQKIEDDPKHPKHLLTLRGMGYKFLNE